LLAVTNINKTLTLKGQNTNLASLEIGKAFPVVRRCEVQWAHTVAA